MLQHCSRCEALVDPNGSDPLCPDCRGRVDGGHAPGAVDRKDRPRMVARVVDFTPEEVELVDIVAAGEGFAAWARRTLASAARNEALDRGLAELVVESIPLATVDLATGEVLDLDEEEIGKVVELIRDPPEPTDALRRALARVPAAVPVDLSRDTVTLTSEAEVTIGPPITREEAIASALEQLAADARVSFERFGGDELFGRREAFEEAAKLARDFAGEDR